MQARCQAYTRRFILALLLGFLLLRLSFLRRLGVRGLLGQKARDDRMSLGEGWRRQLERRAQPTLQRLPPLAVHLLRNAKTILVQVQSRRRLKTCADLPKSPVSDLSRQNIPI